MEYFHKKHSQVSIQFFRFPNGKFSTVEPGSPEDWSIGNFCTNSFPGTVALLFVMIMETYCSPGPQFFSSVAVDLALFWRVFLSLQAFPFSNMRWCSAREMWMRPRETTGRFANWPKREQRRDVNVKGKALLMRQSWSTCTTSSTGRTLGEARSSTIWRQRKNFWIRKSEPFHPIST